MNVDIWHFTCHWFECSVDILGIKSEMWWVRRRRCSTRTLREVLELSCFEGCWLKMREWKEKRISNIYCGSIGQGYCFRVENSHRVVCWRTRNNLVCNLQSCQMHVLLSSSTPLTPQGTCWTFVSGLLFDNSDPDWLSQNMRLAFWLSYICWRLFTRTGNVKSLWFVIWRLMVHHLLCSHCGERTLFHLLLSHPS